MILIERPKDSASVLVTGASGFVGRHLTAALRDSGMRVRGTYRGAPPGIAGIEWRPSPRLDSVAHWEPLLRDTDAVVHLAALVHQTGGAAASLTFADYARVNVDGTRALARACAAAGVGRIVFLSSIAVYGRALAHVDEHSPMQPDDDYGRSKLAAEEALQQELRPSRTDWCILRPPLVYGPGAPGNLARLRALVVRGLPLPFAAVNNRRSFMFVDNLVDAILTVMRFPGSVRAAYVLGDGSDYATPGLVRALAAGSGRRARLVPVPVALLRALARGVVMARTIDSLTGTLLTDSTRFRAAFGWQPRVPPAEAFARSYGAAP